MSGIRVLSGEVIGKISAGEVVERPSSAVKELIENSLDAGADSIEIEVQAGGTDLIRIADNGTGMTSEEARMAVLRHATSKLSAIEDLGSISTLGFRGEALASISAVSKMTVITKVKDADAGTCLTVEGGKISEEKPAGRSSGTTVEVRELFFNVPARRKFLRRESTELSDIVSVVGKFILSSDGVEFKLEHSGRVLLHATRKMDLTERIRLVLGGDLADHMISLSDRYGDIKVRGYVSRPSVTRRDRRGQVFFVNGRYVRSKAINDAVYVAYRTLLERGRYPSAVLFVELPPSDLDVNVHPTKLEVKFENEKAVKDAVRHTLTRGFELLAESEPLVISRPEVAGAADVPEDAFPGEALSGADSNVQSLFNYKKEDVDGQSSSGDYRHSFEGADDRELSRSGHLRNDPSRAALYQIGGCYIVEVKAEAIRVVDQHAAHERILYEYFLGCKDDTRVEVQDLLFPVRIELSPAEALLMEQLSGKLCAMGFEIEPFGDTSFIVQGAPAILKDMDVKPVVSEILSDMTGKDLSGTDVVDELIKVTACRAAIRSGDLLAIREMELLLEQLDECDLPFTCPHGRPTVLDIGLEELEKRFRRK